MIERDRCRTASQPLKVLTVAPASVRRTGKRMSPVWGSDGRADYSKTSVHHGPPLRPVNIARDAQNRIGGGKWVTSVVRVCETGRDDRVKITCRSLWSTRKSGQSSFSTEFWWRLEAFIQRRFENESSRKTKINICAEHACRLTLQQSQWSLFRTTNYWNWRVCTPALSIDS